MNKTLLFFLIVYQLSIAQVDTSIDSGVDNSFEFGGSIKFTFEIQKHTNFRLSLAGGVGKKIPDLEFFYPALHTELQIYNGGIGSSLQNNKKGKLVFDFIVSTLLTGGIREVKEKGYAARYNPLYYFSDLSALPLQNPYYNSFSLGSNYIISSDKDRENQYVGVLNFNFERTIQITYYNDGTPFGIMHIADGYDRYYTGGGVISYHGDYTDFVNLVELSFHRFTGYQRFAFETANHMQIDYVPYNNPEEFYYNLSKYKLKVSNYDNGFGANIAIYNYNFKSVQDKIHYTIDAAYHQNTLSSKHYAFGIDYNYVNWTSK